MIMLQAEIIDISMSEFVTSILDGAMHFLVWLISNIDTALVLLDLIIY